MIEVRDLHFSHGRKPVLNGIALSIKAGERVAILGGNGSGKSTLAHWLSGWLAPPAGSPDRVFWKGRPWRDYSICERAVAVQLVGQIPSQHLSGRAFTVSDEISFGPENLGWPVEEVIVRRDRALAACRLERLADRDPFTLSGGEQQRLVIAAALALNPALLILDEPFTNLDPESRAHLAAVLADLPPEVMLITFDTNPNTALLSASRFLLLHEGQIVADGDARTVLLADASVEALGLPAIARAFHESISGTEVPKDAFLPLTLGEAAALFRQEEPSC
jgi:energy-coupling factor transporter ATP-binding protein EcfA2